jgi:hypothetical protein
VAVENNTEENTPDQGVDIPQTNTRASEIEAENVADQETADAQNNNQMQNSQSDNYVPPTTIENRSDINVNNPDNSELQDNSTESQAVNQTGDNNYKTTRIAGKGGSGLPQTATMLPQTGANSFLNFVFTILTFLKLI